jgi:hypothetical protein
MGGYVSGGGKEMRKPVRHYGSTIAQTPGRVYTRNRPGAGNSALPRGSRPVLILVLLEGQRRAYRSVLEGTAESGELLNKTAYYSPLV